MATRTINLHTLVCDGDGCEATIGVTEPFASTIEARAAAYAAGWRFPERYKASGGEARTANDVCPACVPGWTRQPAANNWEARGRTGGALTVACPRCDANVGVRCIDLRRKGPGGHHTHRERVEAAKAAGPEDQTP